MEIGPTVPPADFYPRPPRGGRPSPIRSRRLSFMISIHVLREEDDISYVRYESGERISIHVLREDDDPAQAQFRPSPIAISIHVLREEDDPNRHSVRSGWPDFYPRPPRGGRRIHSRQKVPGFKFLSTSSARRTTVSIRNRYNARIISIHVLREEDDPVPHSGQVVFLGISIHVLREEDD